MKTLGIFAVVLLAITGCIQAQDRRLTPSGSAGRRIALVIGNDSYASMPLRNARNDARAVRDTLRDASFDVDYVEDATRAGFAHAMDTFSAKLQRDDIALFYYSGHGLAVDGANYLLPIDFAAQSEADVPFSAYPALQVQRKLEERGTRLNIIVLDACRDNPFHYSRSAGGGLAAMRESVGTLIAFAAADGQRASDNGSESNGLFTKYLLESMREPGLSVRDMFFRVQERVYEASSHRQFPSIYAGTVGQFYFRPAAGTVATPSNSSDLHAQADLVYWQSIRESRNPAVFEDYLRRFPDGQFVVPAKSKLDELRAVVQPPPMPRNNLVPAQQFQITRYDHSAGFMKNLVETGRGTKERTDIFGSTLSVSLAGIRITENNKADIEVPCRDVLSRIKILSNRLIVDDGLYYSLFNNGAFQTIPVVSAVHTTCNVVVPVAAPPGTAAGVAAPGQQFKILYLEGADLDWIRQHAHDTPGTNNRIPKSSHFSDADLLITATGLQITEPGQVDIRMACESISSRILLEQGHFVVDGNRWYGVRDLTPSIIAAISSNCNVQINVPAPGETTTVKKSKKKE